MPTNSRRIFRSVGAGALVLGVLWVLPAAFGQYGPAFKGQTVDAVVLSSYYTTGLSPKGHEAYDVTYPFTGLRGDTFVGRDSRGLGGLFQASSSIRVVYLPGDPQGVELEGTDWLALLVVSATVAYMLSVAVYHAVRAVFRSRLASHLQQVGVEAIGTVRAVGAIGSQDRFGHQLGPWVFQYTFQDRDGHYHCGEVELLRPCRLTPGTTGKVKYDPEHPNTSMWIG